MVFSREFGEIFKNTCLENICAVLLVRWNNLCFFDPKQVSWKKLKIPFTAWKVSKYGVISGRYFPVLGPSMGKYEPEITTYLDNFHTVNEIILA